MLKFIDNNELWPENETSYLENTLDHLDFFDYERIKISDVVLGETYYFLYRVQGYPSSDLYDTNAHSIPTKILNLMENGYDIRIIITTFHESDSRDSLQKIKEYCDTNGIKQKSVYIINGNSSIDLLQKEFGTNFNVYSNQYIPMTMSRQMDFDGNHGFHEDRMYKFQCFNRNVKNHRWAILAFLKYKNIINETDWSNLYGTRLADFYDNETDKFYYFRGPDKTKILTDEYIEKFNEPLEWLLGQGDKKPDTEEFKFDQNGPQHDLSYKHNIYRYAYINIVTETQYYWDNVIHITEKTTQPLWFYQIPIIVATPFHIKKTKELYDLDFFDDYVDHSYDNETNHIKRMLMIFDEIERLSKIDKEDMRKYFNQKRIKKRLYENRNKIRLIQFSENDYNFYKQLPK
jgi:hypothetical protein